MDAVVAQNPGLRGTVRTTLDLDLQATVERLARSHLSALNRHDITQAAVVVIENATGAIRAMVGSENYAVSQINGATQPRSCGSTLKPFVYLEAIDKRLFTAASLLPDTPDAIRNEYADYDPQNYSHHYFGPVRLREALACSLNVPAVFVLSQLGARPTFYQLQKWGFNFPQGLDEYGAGFVLGMPRRASLILPLRMPDSLAAGQPCARKFWYRNIGRSLASPQGRRRILEMLWPFFFFFFGGADDYVLLTGAPTARVTAIAAQAAGHMFQGEVEEMLPLIDEKTLPIAEPLGLDEVGVWLLHLRGFTQMAAAGAPESSRRLRAGYCPRLRVHAFEQLQIALNNLFATQLAMAQLEAARETLAALKRNAERHSTDARRGWIAVIPLELELTSGNWAEASRMADEYIAESEGDRTHYLDGQSRYVRATIRLGSGDLPGAAVDMEQALVLARRRGDAQLLAPALVGSIVLLEEGRRDEASMLAAEALELGPRFVAVAGYTSVIHAAWLMRDLGLRGGSAVGACGRRWPHHRAYGGQGSKLQATFGRAADVLEETGYPTGEAYAQLRAAKQLVEEGRRAEADVELNRALAFYREVGATTYVREGEALLAESA